MKEKMMNSKFGKLLRRLVGEETGAVMMEYVIVAVLVAAVCVVAVIYFGQTTSKQFNAATEAVAVNTDNAVKKAGEAQKRAKDGSDKSVEHANKFGPDHQID